MNLRNILMVVFVLALTVGLTWSSRTVSAAADRQINAKESARTVGVPFKGTLEGYDAVMGPDLHLEGTGTATLLGKFSLVMDVTLNFIDFTDAGSAQWIAANGDSIDTDVEGFAVPGPDVFTITEVHTVTGGTGRFAGAEGSFTVVRSHIVAPSDDGSHVTFGSFEGIITPPGPTS